jgi:hypothetical protein
MRRLIHYKRETILLPLIAAAANQVNIRYSIWDLRIALILYLLCHSQWSLGQEEESKALTSI